MARLFVAVWPPEEVVAELYALHRKDQRGVHFVRAENWHLTLRFLGEARPADVAAALDDAVLPATHVALGPAVDVFYERALIVPASGLDALSAEVERVTGDLGEPPRKRFVGHLTVARLHRRAQMPRTLGEPISAGFDVDEIALVQSRLHPDGARYETLATWPVPTP